MKKLLTVALSFALCTAAITSCDKAGETQIPDPDPAITIETSEFTIDSALGSEAVVTFSVNVEWTAVVSYEEGEEEWLTVTPESGETRQNIEMTLKAVTANNDEATRTAYITINYGGESHTLTAIQSGFVDENITEYFDPGFAARLKMVGYIPNAERIMRSDVRSITTLYVTNYRGFGMPTSYPLLTSLSGIEYFEALTMLNCRENQLTSLDMSNNLKHTNIKYQSNQLS